MNYRIGTEAHILSTSSVNKIALSAFDNKRYICEDGIKTIAFGHHCLVEEEMTNYALNEVNEREWGEWGLEEETIGEERPVEENVNMGEGIQSPWRTPDPGMHRPTGQDSDNMEDIIDWNRISDQEPSQTLPRNPFVEMEAIEEPASPLIQIVHHPEEGSLLEHAPDIVFLPSPEPQPTPASTPSPLPRRKKRRIPLKRVDEETKKKRWAYLPPDSD